MSISAGTCCCGKCGRWFYGYYCPHCKKENEAQNKNDKKT